MVLVRRLVELGRATRAESGVKTRQPLSRALVGAVGFETLDRELHAQITEELNVSSLASLSEVGGSLVDTTAKANFRALGKRFGKGVQAVAKAIAETDARPSPSPCVRARPRSRSTARRSRWPRTR